MKKTLTALVLLLLAGCAFAADSAQKGYISVSVEKTEEFPPSSIKISFAVITRAADAQSAAENNKNVSKKAIEAVKALLDNAKSETIKTANYTTTPEYKYKNGSKELTGYLSTNTLEVQVKDSEKIGKVISTALSNGANKVSSLNFVLEENNENCNLLIQEASKEAKIRAEKVAEASNTSLAGIKSINAGCSTSQNTNVRMLNSSYAGSADASEGADVPIEPGKVKLRAYINAEYFVK